MSRVILLLTSPSPASPMQAHDEVQLVPGRGIVGDRYYEGCGTFSPHPARPDFELTLIESEKIAEFALESGLDFTAAHARRNVVTVGVDLNALVGEEFTVGAARLRGIRLCEPCAYLAKVTHPEVLRGLVHKGGLRAQVLSGGPLRRGDPVRTALSPSR